MASTTAANNTAASSYSYCAPIYCRHDMQGSWLPRWMSDGRRSVRCIGPLVAILFRLKSGYGDACSDAKGLLDCRERWIKTSNLCAMAHKILDGSFCASL